MRKRRFWHRWETVAIARDGRVIGTKQFMLRWSANRAKAWDDKTAEGAHPFMTPLTHGPLFTTEVRRCG